jgi:predicted aldo/keto reductase-like oxidoreductase
MSESYRPAWLNGWLVITAWVITCLFGYFALGGFFADRFEGIDHNQIAKGPSLIGGIVGFIAVILTAWWAFTLKRKGAPTEPASGRRKFITGSAAITGGVVGVAGATAARMAGWATVTGQALGTQTESTSPNPKAAWRGAEIQSYRPLGNTGLMVSDISAGSTRLHNNADPVGFLTKMLDRGVNYIDASPDYAPQSEGIIREAIAGRDRSKLVIATKFCTQHGHLQAGSSVKQYMDAMESAITRLGTDYVDVAHIHSCDSIDRLMDENVHEAVDRLREQGKVRFMGVSTHTPNLEQVANTAIDSGRFQVMMLAYHHGAWPNQQQIIARAASKGMGIVAMKTLKGAKHNGLADFELEKDSYTQAAFKWVLSNSNVSNLVISFHNDQHLDEYLFASGQALHGNDIAVLEKYDHLIAGTHCFQHCGACLNTCPSNVPIHDVLRHRMYFEDYGDQKQAMGLYAKLEQNASACIDCDAPCTGACPVDIPIRSRMLGAHEMLT